MKQSEHPVYGKLAILGKHADGRVVVERDGRRLLMSREAVVEYVAKREEAIEREREDPWNHGIRLKSWDRAEAQWESVRELLILGGNRSGKTEYAAWSAVRQLVEKEGARVWCLHSSAQSSIALQQPYVWRYLPPEWRTAGKKGVVTNISYTQKNGFSEGTFVCPNGSQCWFLNYMQDPTVFEGGECDLIWCDELVGLDLIRTLRYRLVTRNGRLLVTFTPIEGYSATVKEYLTGARTLEDVEGELLPIRGEDGAVLGLERVPLIQEARNTMKRARIVYFHTRENPFGGYKGIVEELERAPREEILCRAYGVPTKAIAGRFAGFVDGRPHVVQESEIPRDGTNFHIVDPCGGRNWFMIWVRVDVRGRLWVYREWPCESGYVEGVGYPGKWAIPGKKADGERGPAQRGWGFGLLRYKEEMERLEGDEVIFERYMDSRYANSTSVGKELVTTLLEECAEVGMFFSPAPGEHIDEGIELVNDLLAFDRSKPVGVGNEPRLFVSEKCTNLIWALKEWTGQDGRHGACKDPVDCLRYAALADLQYLEGDVLAVKQGGTY